VPDTNKLDEIKKELKGFTSLHGFSTVLNTSIFFLVLFSSCIQNVFENINDYYEYTVITKIEYVNEYPMALPALTLCLDTFLSSSTNVTLNEFLLNCSIAAVECDIKDFYSFETRTSFNTFLVCYVLNGGRNSSGHLSEIKSSRTTGVLSGFFLQFYVPKNHLFLYYINDAHVKPTTSEINKYFPRGTTNDFILEKSVETKLEFPFNNCWDRISLPNTPLVRQLSEANITYRQVNCFELCLKVCFRKQNKRG